MQKNNSAVECLEIKMGKKFILSIITMLLTVLFVFAACSPKSSDGDGADTTDKPGDEYTLECPSGYNQVTIYWNRPSGIYDDCDVWMWYGGGDGVALTFHKCEYGGKVILNVPEDTIQVGYIVRTNCPAPGFAVWDGIKKDGTDADRYLTLRGKSTVIYLKSGDPNAYESNDGGKTLTILRYIVLADMVNSTRVRVTMSDASIKINTLSNVKILDGDGAEIALKGINGNNEIVTQTALDVSKPYKLHIDNYDDVGVVPSTYFSSADFEAQYTYDGPLGVEIGENKVIFRLWAPTASRVVLNLYRFGYMGDSNLHFDLIKGEKGVWTYEGDRYDGEKEAFVNKYYTYSVTTSIGTQEAVDPYARSASINGERGMILDLDATDPEGWTDEVFTNYADGYKVENYTDANIWEIHVRDFSNMIEGSKYKGKYLAFTETGLTNSAGIPVGVDYLKRLGITHVHLLPSYDYASVDESEESGQFNWGYDPENYNVPEGSYATDAEDGRVRVNEYKRMVQALHNAGIGVIMDVVYNHTYSADSNFNKIVPYYYYRYNSNGTLSNGSGCGNETASERSMVRKFIVDSVTYWQSEYNLDGFRFDLMGLHDIQTMQEVEQKVHAHNPHALIYGEGWTGGSTTLSGDRQSKLDNIGKLNGSNKNGVAMFNDVIRDGVKGSVFNISDTGFATGAKEGYLGNVLFGVQGGFYNTEFTGGYNASWNSSSPTNVINYVSAHDNNTLWDRICYVYGTDASTLSSRLAKNRLSAAIVQTSLGVPFMQAGEEMLRTKTNPDGTYNENSYNASDEVNNLKWEELTLTSVQYQTMQYYKGLIAFRKATPALRLAEIDAQTCKIVKKEGAFVAFTITNGSEQLLIVYNATESSKELLLPDGSWNLYINGTQSGTTAIETGISGKQTIEGISCYVYKNA